MPTPYTIKEGDTWDALATSNKTDSATLSKLNPDVKDPNKIQAGATLNLPDAPNPTLAGISTSSGIASSAASTAAKAAADKAAADTAAKNAADQEKQIADLSRQNQIKTLKSQLEPTGGEPAAPDLTGTYKSLLGEKDATGNSVEDYQAKLAANDKSIADIKSGLSTFNASAAQGQPEAAFLSQKSEKERLAQESIDSITRESTLISNQISNRTNVINTLMGLTKDDYANSKAKYDQEFSKNVTLMNELNTEKSAAVTADDKARDNARANLQILQNEIQKGTLSYNNLDPGTRATINELEHQAGLPKGFTSFVSANVKGDVLSTASRTDGTNEYFDVITRSPGGGLSVTSVLRGKGGADATGALTTAQVQKLQAAGVPETVYTRLTQAILAGVSLDDIRGALKKDGFDPKVLDQFDNAVGIEKLLETGNSPG